MPVLPLNIATTDASLLLYAEMDEAAIRSAQRQLKAGKLFRIVSGVVSASLPEQWPTLIARERLRVLAALFPQSVLACRSAFNGGQPEGGEIHLTSSYRRYVALPGLTVVLWKGPPPAAGDLPMQGREIYFRSLPRTLLENLMPSRGNS